MNDDYTRSVDWVTESYGTPCCRQADNTPLSISFPLPCLQSQQRSQHAFLAPRWPLKLNFIKTKLLYPQASAPPLSLSSSQLKVTQLSTLAVQKRWYPSWPTITFKDKIQPPKPATSLSTKLATSSFSFTPTPPRCLFKLCLFDWKITFFSLVHLLM